MLPTPAQPTISHGQIIDLYNTGARLLLRGFNSVVSSYVLFISNTICYVGIDSI